MKFLPFILLLAGCAVKQKLRVESQELTTPVPVPMLAIPVPTPAPTVTHLAWNYTNATCSADLQFQVEQSTNLIDWKPLGTSYCLSLSVTSCMAHAFYRIKTLVP